MDRRCSRQTTLVHALSVGCPAGGAHYVAAECRVVLCAEGSGQREASAADSTEPAPL